MRFPRTLFLLALVFSPLLRAQQPWTAASSPTTSTLWGVCFANNQFVAVGEGGTILSSSGATTWAPRASGTSRWLLAVAWSPAANLFVAVGDAGTILTSPDAVTWTACASSTTQRLNSIAWGGGTFLAVGEHGIALTSPDGRSWTVRPTGDNGWLRGIAYGQGAFVVTGHDDTILTSSDGGASFVRRTSPIANGLDAAVFAGNCFYVVGDRLARSPDGIAWTEQPNLQGPNPLPIYNGAAFFNDWLVLVGDNGLLRTTSSFWTTETPLTTSWRAVACSPSRCVAVGSDGGIAWAPLDTTLGVAVDVTATVADDGSVTFHASTTRPNATEYSWSNPRGVFAASPSLTSVTIDPLAVNQGGRYSVTVTFDGYSGRGYGTYYLPSLDPSVNTAGLIDESFHSPLTVPPTVIQPLANGQLYVAADQTFPRLAGGELHALARLNVDGSVDATFHPDFGPDDHVSGLILQPDGKLLVRGTSTLADPVATMTLARLNTDGSRDTSFTPDPTLRDSANPPILLQDGRWLTAAATHDENGNRTVSLARFLADGKADPAFPAVILVPPTAVPAGPWDGNSYFGHLLSTMDDQGRVYLAIPFGGADRPHLGWDGPSGLLFRLNTDGMPDRGFAVRTLDAVNYLQATRRGLVCLTSKIVFNRPNDYAFTIMLFRMAFDGTDDRSFRPTVLDNSGFSPLLPSPSYDFESVVAAEDGSVYATLFLRYGRRGIVRLNPDGTFDRDFAAELFDLPHIFEPLTNGQLLVGPTLCRITPQRHATATRLSNISIRTRAGTGDDTLILGFVTTGGTKQFLLRAAGPALTNYGVSDPLADPQLSLFAGSQLAATNDDWTATVSSATTAVGAFPFAAGSRDAALLASLPARNYTLHVTGKNAGSGIALAELYDTDPAPADATAPRLVNFSARANSGGGDDILIAGFTISGDDTRTVLIRAVGPTLAAQGVANPLTDPRLGLYRGGKLIAANDDWANLSDNLQYVRVRNAMTSTGAFPLDAFGKDAALLVTLPAGSYTVHVSGANQGTGVALVEIYEVDLP